MVYIKRTHQLPLAEVRRDILQNDIILEHGSDMILMSIDEAREIAAHIDEVGL